MDGLPPHQAEAHAVLSYGTLVWEKVENAFISCNINILLYIFQMNINPSTLPDDSDQLKRMLLDFKDHHDKETDILPEKIRRLRAQLFGRKIEKAHVEGGPMPLPLFDMPETMAEEDEPVAEQVQVPAHNRKKKGRKPLSADRPRTELIHDLDSAENIRACGCELGRIGEGVSELLDIVPAQISQSPIQVEMQ